jgi:fibronectin-binding autotransporter adhesin
MRGYGFSKKEEELLSMPQSAPHFLRSSVIAMMVAILVCPPDLVAGRVDSLPSTSISTGATTLEIENSVFNSFLHGQSQTASKPDGLLPANRNPGNAISNGRTLNLSTGTLSLASADISVIAGNAQTSTLAFNNQTVATTGNGIVSSDGRDDPSTAILSLNQSQVTVNNFLNQALVYRSDAVAITNLSNGSTLTVNGDFTTTARTSQSGFGQAQINLDGSTLSVHGNMSNTAFNLNAPVVFSAVSLTNGSSIMVGGQFSNRAGSLLLQGSNNTLTASGFDNGTGTLTLDAGGNTADFRAGGASGSGTDTFRNLTNSGGSLAGGTYQIGDGGKFLYDPTSDAAGGKILTLNAEITLAGTGQILYGPGAGADALQSLGYIYNGSLTYESAGTRTIQSPSGSSRVTGGGTLIVGGGSALNVNNTNLTIQGNLSLGLGLGSGSLTMQDSQLTTTGNLLSWASGNLSLTRSTLDIGGTFTNQSEFDSFGQNHISAGKLVNQSTMFLYNGDVTIRGSADNQSGAQLNLGLLNIGDPPPTLSVQQTLSNEGDINLSTGGRSLIVSGAIINSGNITLNGGGNVVTAAGLTNTGNITLGNGDFLDVRNGGAGVLTNLYADAAAGPGAVLHGGNYNLTGSLYYDKGANGSTYINTIQNASLTLTGAGTHLGFHDPAHPSDPSQVINSLGQLAALNNSSLTLSGQTLNVNPGGSNGALIFNNSTVTLSSNTAVHVAGVLDVEGGSVTLNGGGNVITATGLTNNGSITVGNGDVLDVRNGGAGVLTNLYADAAAGPGGVLHGGNYNLSANLTYDKGADGSTYITTLQNASLALSGAGTHLGFQDPAHSSDPSQVIDSLGHLAVLNNSSLTLSSNAAVHAAGMLDVEGGSVTLNGGGNVITATGLTNNGSIAIGGGDVLDVRNGGAGVLTNLYADSAAGPGGVLHGGNYNLAGSLNYDKGRDGSTYINTLQNANVTLNGAGTHLGFQDPAHPTDPLQVTDALGQITRLNSSSLTLNGQSLNLAAGVILTNSALTLAGSSLIVAGALDIGGGSVVSVQSAGLQAQGLTNNGLLSIGFGSGGDFRVGGAAGNSTGSFTNLANGILSGGTYDIYGLLRFDPSSGAAGGNITKIAAGTSVLLEVSGAHILYGPGTGTDALSQLAEVAGSLTLKNSIDFTPEGGTLVVDAGGSLSYAYNRTVNTINGSLSNDGSLSLSGRTRSFTVTGNFTNSGTTQIASRLGSTFNVNGDLNNTGTLIQGGGITNLLSTNNTFTVLGNLTNTGGGLYSIADGHVSNVNGVLTNGAGSSIDISGSAFGSVGSVSSSDTSLIAGSIVNAGTISIHSSQLDFVSLTAGSLTNTGVLNIEAGSEANLTTLTNVDGQTGILSGGTYNIGGTLVYGGPGIRGIGAGTSLTRDARNDYALILASGGIALANLTSNAGRYALMNGVQFETSTTPTGGTFTNSGTIETGGTGGNLFNVNGAVFNTSAGVVNLGSAGDSMSSNGQFLNAGTVAIGSGASLTVGPGSSYTQTAGKTLVNGTLTADTIDLQGGILSGGGNIAGNVMVDGGTLAPGDPQTIQITGNYDQTLAGMLVLDFAGPLNYDQIQVTGNATLNGTLRVTLENGFLANLGDVFHIFSWTGTGSGDFSSFFDPTFSGGSLTFREVFNGQRLDLLVVSTVQSQTPEPGTFGMLLAGLFVGGFAWRSRRRANKPSPGR